MSNRSLLVYVENDPGSRKVLQLLMTRLPYPVELALFEDSARFIPQVEALPVMPDVFLLDIHVLPLDGFEMLRRLRAHPTFAHKMVVAITASVMNAEVQSLREAGFDGVLAKPLHFHSFPTTLDRIMAGERIWAIQR